MRKTKIVCTLGPASDNYETLKEMVLAGMNVVRINMSHGTHEEHRKKIDLIKKIREELGVPLPIMLDTKGPEVRIGTFACGRITLNEGDPFIFTTEECVGDNRQVSVNYPNLHRDLSEGDTVLLNDGLMGFRVTKVCGKQIHTEVLNAGVLSDRKSMSFPDVQLSLPFLSERDAEDLLFAVDVDAEFVAASFVSSPFDVREMRNFLKRKGGKDIEIIAKIENSAGVENIEAIMQESDGIMVARGDLGVEIPYEQLPAIQKKLIKTCRMLGKRVITATEMLESMIEKPRPTRAEISDVANAVYDGTSCLMLSGETAVGRDPVLVVKTMAKIAEQTEQNINYDCRFKQMDFQLRNVQDAVSHGTCNTAIDLSAKAITVFTVSGMSARMLSRFRSSTPILGLTANEKTFHKLALSWGVVPVRTATFSSTDAMFEEARICVAKSGFVKRKELFVIAAGVPVNSDVATNLIKVEQL
ncbi:MAG: pyruvate kinase [Clostridia bacterium]|nr:pyruvate kinase [Clostridia bacterium]